MAIKDMKQYQFRPGQSGNPNGRPKNRVNQFLQSLLPKTKAKVLKQELSRCEIDTIERQVLQLELSDLQLIAKSDKTPVYLKTLVIAMMIDMKNGRTGTVDKLRDRQYGAVKQDIEVKNTLNFADMLIETGLAETEDDNGTTIVT